MNSHTFSLFSKVCPWGGREMASTYICCISQVCLCIWLLRVFSYHIHHLVRLFKTRQRVFWLMATQKFFPWGGDRKHSGWLKVLSPFLGWWYSYDYCCYCQYPPMEDEGEDAMIPFEIHLSLCASFLSLSLIVLSFSLFLSYMYASWLLFMGRGTISFWHLIIFHKKWINIAYHLQIYFYKSMSCTWCIPSYIPSS